MIDINGRRFAKNDVEFNSTLFKQGGTATGFYKMRNNGILFFNLQQKPFLFLCRNDPSSPFFVSCSQVEINGKKQIRYMQSTCSLDEKTIGIDALGYMQTIDLCKSIKETVEDIVLDNDSALMHQPKRNKP